MKSEVHAYNTIGHNISIFHKNHNKTMRAGYFDITIINNWNQLPSEVLNPFAPSVLCVGVLIIPFSNQFTAQYIIEWNYHQTPALLFYSWFIISFIKNISVIFKMLKVQNYEEYEPNSDGSDISYSQKRRFGGRSNW